MLAGVVILICGTHTDIPLRQALWNTVGYNFKFLKVNKIKLFFISFKILYHLLYSADIAFVCPSQRNMGHHHVSSEGQ